MKNVAVARLRAAAAAAAAASASIDDDAEAFAAAAAAAAAFTVPPLLRFLEAEDGGDVLWTAPAAAAGSSLREGVLEKRERKKERKES